MFGVFSHSLVMFRQHNCMVIPLWGRLNNFRVRVTINVTSAHAYIAMLRLTQYIVQP